MTDDITLSALVVLRPYRPAPDLRGAGGHTEGNHPPARETVEAAIEFFARMGFTIGDVVGTSFWIKGHSHQFESLFGQTLEIQGREDRVESVRLSDGSTELDLALLPDEISRHLLAVKTVSRQRSCRAARGKSVTQSSLHRCPKESVRKLDRAFP